MFRSPPLIPFFALLLMKAYSTHSYSSYQTQIPNGAAVPNPCTTNETWPGVGHQNPIGGGDRNLFGIDFAANGHVWNQTLCNKDSDGDGKTNGQELGDPGCQWTAGGTFQPATTGLSHPGICEPINSTNCLRKNSWFHCELNDSCPAINETDVLFQDIRIPTVNITPDYTTYMCHYVDLPRDKKYHIIAAVPLIDNYHVVHHLAIFGCTDAEDAANKLPRQPWECPLTPACLLLVAVYSYGQHSDCFPTKFGIPMGNSTGVRHAILQIHYTNMDHHQDHTDSSGMRLYYTPNLRTNDASVSIGGQNYLSIPPNQEAYVQSGYCPKECSAVLNTTVNITDIYLHMHLLGTWMNVTHYRGGVPLKLLVSESFVYSSPRRVYLEEEEVFLPGDEIRVDCVFDTRSRSNVTTFGEGTNDEMCLALATYYPANERFAICTQWKDYAACTEYFVAAGCNTTTLIGILLGVDVIQKQCNLSLGCQEPCVANVVNDMAATGCLDGDRPEFLIFALQRYPTQVQQFIQLMALCYSSLPVVTTPALTTVKSSAVMTSRFCELQPLLLLSALSVLMRY